MNEYPPTPKAILLLAFGLCMIFITVGMILGAYFYKDIIYAKESKNWPSAVATIISTERFRTGEGAGTQAGVKYSYKVEGKEYEGHRLCFGMSITEMDERVWRSLPDEGDITIHYHPEKHSLSTIGVKFDPKDQWILAFPGALIAFGAFIIACMLPTVFNRKAQPVAVRQ